MLCGKLMGLPTPYILQQLPKIVQFSGMEKWIHRPVKQYSQGMFVRLAFAITTQLKADIFLFDEVLSIGDYAFQQQCLNQIQTLKKQKKTLLIVSHDLHTILQIVDHFLLLKHGKLQYFGKDSAPLIEYVRRNSLDPALDKKNAPTPLLQEKLQQFQTKYGLKIKRISAKKALSNTKPVEQKPIEILLQLQTTHNTQAPDVIFHLHDLAGHTLTTFSNLYEKNTAK